MKMERWGILAAVPTALCVHSHTPDASSLVLELLLIQANCEPKEALNP